MSPAQNGAPMVTYRLIKTMGRPFNNLAVIDSVDATRISLLALSQLYYDIYFVVNRSDEKFNRVLYFKDIPLEAQISDDTIVQWLTKQGNKNLMLSTELPFHKRGEVYSWDALSFGFDYVGIKQGYHPKANIPDEDKPDLLLTKQGTDYLEVGDFCLIAINGLLHNFEVTENGWIVHGGNTTKYKHPMSTHVNVLDFTQVGRVYRIPIETNMVSKLTDKDAYMALNRGFYINTGVDLRNKTVGISLGGYLHLLDHTYKQVSDTTIRVNFSEIRWESLFYKIKELVDISSMPITDFKDDRVIGFELYHDLTILALLQLPQSFIFVIDNPNVSVTYEPVGHIGYPKRYESAIPPIYPLRIGEGRYPAYKAVKDFDKWVIAVEDNIIPLQVRYQKTFDTFHILHNRIYPTDNEVYATAHYVRILSDKDIKVRVLDELIDGKDKHLGGLRPYMLKNHADDEEYIKQDIYYIPPTLARVNLDDDYYKPVTDRFTQLKLQSDG